MKNIYENPIITVEILEKVDVLLDSEQTDNRHIKSSDLIKRDAQGKIYLGDVL